MKYPELIYQGARAAGDYGDPSVDYNSFIMKNMEQDPDYAAYIDRAYHEANAFLQRVSALGKVPCKIKEFEPVGADTAAELTMGSDFLTAVSVFQYEDDERRKDYDVLPFRKLGNKVYVLGRYSPYRKIYVQYRPKLPILGKGDIAWVTDDGLNHCSVTKANANEMYEYAELDDALAKADELQIDLTEEYEISDEVLLLGVDWIRARLKEDVSKGHSEEMEVESRLNDLESDEFLYLQKKGGRIAL